MGEAEVKFDILDGHISQALAARLAPDEAAVVCELSARDDTKTLLVSEGEKVVGYAVFGFDLDDMIVVYAARSLNHFVTSCAMKAFFGCAQILGTPLRVHADKLRGNPMARMMGADKWIKCKDTDGVDMAVFNAEQI